MATSPIMRAADIEAGFEHAPPRGFSGELCNWRYTCPRTQRRFNIRELEVKTRFARRGSGVPGKPATRVLFFLEEFVPSCLLRYETDEGVHYDRSGEVQALIHRSPNHFFAALQGLDICEDNLVCRGAPTVRNYRSLQRSLSSCADKIRQALVDNQWLLSDPEQLEQ